VTAPGAGDAPEPFAHIAALANKIETELAEIRDAVGPWTSWQLGVVTTDAEGETIYQGAIGKRLLFGGFSVVDESGGSAANASRFGLFDGDANPANAIEPGVTMNGGQSIGAFYGPGGLELVNMRIVIAGIVGTFSLVLRVREL
jgi:hypothetical protein